jgi:hypothetical protein
MEIQSQLCFEEELYLIYKPINFSISLMVPVLEYLSEYTARTVGYMRNALSRKRKCKILTTSVVLDGNPEPDLKSDVYETLKLPILLIKKECNITDGSKVPI